MFDIDGIMDTYPESPIVRFLALPRPEQERLLRLAVHLLPLERTCAECGQPFTRRRRQLYCTPQCSQRMRDRRKRSPR